nr:retrotransposon protein, putative, unclassified [Tanacetum cinerariifolium]
MAGDDNHDGDHPKTSNTSPSVPPPIQQIPHTISSIKLPILKKGEYDIWAMKMEHYLNHTDYLIWQVIQNGNGLVSVTTDTNGMIKVLPPKTAEEVVARERERKERTTLLMALPEDHLENYIRWLMQKRCRKLSNQGTTTSSSNTQNVAFVSAKNTSSTNDINDDDMEEMVLKWQVAMISIKIKKFHKRTGRKLQFDTKDPVGFDKTKDDSKDLVTIDEEDIDWSGHVEEDAQNYAMMAYSSSNSGSDNEASDLEDTFVNDRYVDGMHAVPLPMTVNYMPSEPDVEIDYSKFSYGPKQTSVDESDSKSSKYDSCESDSSVETTTSMPAPVENAPKVVCEPKVWTDAPIIEEYESDSDNDSVENVKETSTPNHSPKIEKHDRNGHTRKGLGYAFTRKACFVCGSFSHLIRDCDFHEKRMAKQAELTKSKNKDDPHRALKDKRIVDSYFFKIPRQHNMYSFNLKNSDPSGDLACLFAKSSIYESNKWHRRLGHVNFKNLNKLVKGNLVRGLPSKIFKNDHTCVACQKEKQHKAYLENQANKSAGPKKANNSAGTQANDDQSANSEEINLHEEHFVLCIWSAYSTTVKSSGDKIEKKTDFKTCEKPVSQVEQIFLEELKKLKRQEKEAHDAAESLRKEATHDTQNANTSSTNLLNIVSIPLSTAGPSRSFNDDFPFEKKAIRTKWVYMNKKNERGVVVRNKVRLVAQGHRQEEGIDYDEVFSPVARIEAIRIFLAFVSYMGFIVYQMDVKIAFLYGTIDEKVYVSQPPSFGDPMFPNKVYKVVKALYGLHQAPKAWYATLSTFLDKSRYKRGAIDKTLFIKQDKKDIILVQVYVDDIIFGSTKKSWCDEFEELMKNRYQISFMGELTFFLGLQVKQKEDGIFISQDKYVAEILKKFDFLSVKTASTPIETQKPLVKDEEAADVDVHLYRSMIGSLMYLTTSRTDIMFVVCACSRFQTILATSTIDAEYVAAAHCYGQVLWIQNQLLDYGFNLMNTKIYIDNESTIYIVKNPVFHSKTKHIKIRHHFFRDAYEKKLIQVLKIHTDDNVADLLTKAFDVSRFKFLVVNIGMINM